MSWSEVGARSLAPLRLAVLEPSDGSLAEALFAASLPGVDIVVSGPLATLVRSVDFPSDVVVIVGDPEQPDGTLARVGVCRWLGVRVVVLQDGVGPVFRQKLHEAGAECVMSVDDAVEHVLSTAADESVARGAGPAHQAVRLSPAESRALALFSAGASRREVARELGVTLETVKTLLRRARRKGHADGRRLVWAAAT